MVFYNKSPFLDLFLKLVLWVESFAVDVSLSLFLTGIGQFVLILISSSENLFENKIRHITHGFHAFQCVENLIRQQPYPMPSALLI